MPKPKPEQSLFLSPASIVSLPGSFQPWKRTGCRGWLTPTSVSNLRLVVPRCCGAARVPRAEGRVGNGTGEPRARSRSQRSCGGSSGEALPAASAASEGTRLWGFLRFSFLARPLAQSRAAGARRGREPNTHRPGPELRHGPTPAPSPGESPGPGWPARAGHSRGLGDTRAPAGACAPLCGAIPAEGPVSAEGPASPCRGPRAP